MNLTPEQKDQILYHARMAAWHRCEQWNHEEKIEEIVGHDVEIPIEDLAVIVSEDQPELGGDGDFGWEDIEPYLEDEDED